MMTKIITVILITPSFLFFNFVFSVANVLEVLSEI